MNCKSVNCRYAKIRNESARFSKVNWATIQGTENERQGRAGKASVCSGEGARLGGRSARSARDLRMRLHHRGSLQFVSVLLISLITFTSVGQTDYGILVRQSQVCLIYLNKAYGEELMTSSCSAAPSPVFALGPSATTDLGAPRRCPARAGRAWCSATSHICHGIKPLWPAAIGEAVIELRSPPRAAAGCRRQTKHRAWHWHLLRIKFS